LGAHLAQGASNLQESQSLALAAARIGGSISKHAKSKTGNSLWNDFLGIGARKEKYFSNLNCFFGGVLGVLGRNWEI
jgi:hypothetical protein